MNEAPTRARREGPRCAFCEIVAGRAPASTIGRWDGFMAFVPKRPATAGHTLLIPLEHVSTVWDLSAPIASGLAVRVLEIAHAMRSALELDGLNVIQSNGRAATQTVDHLHVHLVPRYDQDAMGSIWPDNAPVDALSAKGASSRIRAKLDSAVRVEE
ncbi:HIT domain-containing protein [Pseudonocardia sp. SID8383]|nr:HIT domain-containing protein [Pseudonocardia sp. SID8383]